ncbi:DddA-like double-stranded DNA deaminase toxin [Labedaea rhizosphaerae]|uniref:Nucleic acid/nucleotide deaminase of polymorphic system toxin n=1 Tax=Labedaea rhizosphaerae TaxID=598644 RepID=A0A4R6SKL5_LABRH|nr:DddA-like double-stranded DNA deaminase toxin [Labedaea rhizosphaerae]TDQ04404.1 nucleic acid/nucleotide deaminase of polymorphic system toxin [Labedaea rhizosphaerae]
MRKFVVAVVVAVLAWIFVVPSCSTTFGCESAPATAHADSGSCPDDIDEAAEDADWAADRIASIEDDPVTTGLLYDEDGTEMRIESGESGDAYDLALEYLQVYPSSVVGDQPKGRQAAGHVESKAAALMRSAGQTSGVLVINHPRGPCPYASRVGCGAAMQLILPEGSTITVWWPGGHRAYRGRAEG